MKKLAKLFAIIALIIGCSFASQAQNSVKIGHIDFNTLLAAMPGIDSVKIKLQKFQQTLSDKLDNLSAELENKYLDYQSKSATMPESIKKSTEKELSDLQGRIDAFKGSAQQDYQAKQQELVAPFIEKAKTAIKDVAKENKYTYVLNAIEDVVLYKDETDDIMPLVKKKLGIQ